jgi:hypothetical protein
MAYATNLAELPVLARSGAIRFDPPWHDPGVPDTVQAFATPAARDAGLRHLTNAILLYQRAILLLKDSTDRVELAWEATPVHLGLAWCLDRAGRKPEAIIAYWEALRIAWRTETYEAGDEDIKQWSTALRTTSCWLVCGGGW